MSWNLYFVVFCIAVILLLIFAGIYAKNDLKVSIKRILENPVHSVKQHLLQYWFVYFLVLLFSAFSILNTQPYLWCNYHDDYYIAKVVQLKGAPHLLDEQYELGLKIARTSFFSYISAQGYRFLNTYELTYSALGSIFGIDLAFFCKFSMCIYIYYIVFLTYKLIVEKFIKNKYTSQYALLIFSLLLIPAGYASSLKLSIRMFENWRFQTAIYYGGSIVRVLALPLLILSFSDLLNKFNFKSVLSFFCVFLFLLSFQTSALSYLLFIAPILVLVFLFKEINTKCSGRKKQISTIIIFALFFLFVTLSDRVLIHFPINISRCNDLIKSYQPYYDDVFICDMFALYGFIPVAMSLYLHREDKNVIYIDLIILFSYLLFRFDKSNYYLAFISQYRFYSILRIMTSVLLLIIIVTGIFIVSLLEIMKERISKIIIPLVSFSLVVCTVTNIYLNKAKVLKYTKAAQGITPQGYSLKILTDNDKMLPNMIVNIGNYFNKLPYGNYRVISEGHIPYKNTYIDNESLLLASNRIELYYQSTDVDSNWYYAMIQKYLKGKELFYTADRIIRQANIMYIITTRKSIAEDLVKYNYKVVYHDNVNHSWVIRRKY